MIRFCAKGVEFRLHVLTLLTAVLAAFTGIGRELCVIIIALALHECAHIVVARVCGISIDRVDLMPFGGAAHMERMYTAPKGRLVLVALAGPAANLALAIVGSALGWWEILNFPSAARIVRVNMLIMLFNLLPALPLDGGRVLYAVSSKWLGNIMAVKLGVLLAHILASALFGLCVIGFFTYGILNISLIIIAVFLIASSLMERRAAMDEGVSSAVRGACVIKPLPARARLVIVEKEAPPESAAKYITPGEPTLFAVLHKGEMDEFITEGAMLKRILSGGSQ